MDPLASGEDVAVVLGRDLTDSEETRAVGILAKASSVFRRRSWQDFTPGTSTVRVKADGGNVRLQQEPVVSVASVLDDKARTLTFTRSGQWLKVLDHNGIHPLASHEFVTVTYSHGGIVPDEVRWAVAEIAARVLRIDPRAAEGVQTEGDGMGPFNQSTTYAAWAIGGSTTLSPDDDRIALSYRYPGRHVYVQQA